MKKVYEISVKREFSAAHRLTDYNGKCENLHGHNWIVEAYVLTNKLDSHGMVLDFHDLKKLLDSVIEHFDHTCLNECEEFKHMNPTSEHIAQVIFDKLSDKIEKDGISVSKVSVWETIDNCATIHGLSLIRNAH